MHRGTWRGDAPLGHVTLAQVWRAYMGGSRGPVQNHGCVTFESAHARALGLGHGLRATGGPNYPWGREFVPTISFGASELPTGRLS